MESEESFSSEIKPNYSLHIKFTPFCEILIIRTLFSSLQQEMTELDVMLGLMLVALPVLTVSCYIFIIIQHFSSSNTRKPWDANKKKGQHSGDQFHFLDIYIVLA